MDSSQTFCLRWESFQHNVTSQFNNLRQQDELVDITLSCEGENIKAHKMMLSACSPYFRDLFKNNRCQEMLVFLKDTSATDLRAVVEFMYNGCVNVLHSQLPSFIRTAEMLQIQGLSCGEEIRGGSPASPAHNRRTSSGHARWPPPVDVQRRTPSEQSATAHGNCWSRDGQKVVKQEQPDEVPVPEDSVRSASHEAQTQELAFVLDQVTECEDTPAEHPAPTTVALGDDTVASTQSTASDAEQRNYDSQGAPGSGSAFSAGYHQAYRQQCVASMSAPVEQQQGPPAQLPLLMHSGQHAGGSVASRPTTAAAPATGSGTRPHYVSSSAAATAAVPGLAVAAAAAVSGPNPAAAAAAPDPGPAATWPVDDPNASQRQLWENVCPVCGRCYRYRRNLTEHLKKHSGQTTCPLCGLQFAMMANMRRHMTQMHRIPRQDVDKLTKKRKTTQEWVMETSGDGWAREEDAG